VKRLFSAIGVLLFITAAMPALALTDVGDRAANPQTARRPIIIDDVIRMSQAGVADDAIIAYIRKYRDRFDVNADDVIALTDAHVSKDVVKFLVDEAAAQKNDRYRDREPVRYYGGVYVDPWYYPGYYYDPFFYGPRIEFGFRFGPRFGHFRGRR
jgi:hypothetical protein